MPGHSVPPGPGALPLQPTPLIGREREVQELCARLLAPEVRLLTLTGAAGCGKTRLAIELAALLNDQCPGGARFADLQSLAEDGAVLAQIAAALGVADSGDGPLEERLLSALRGRNLLLVLDNFEHVVGAAPRIARLLAGAPALKVLVTSRGPLRLRWEHEVPISPLALPDPSRLDERDAVASAASVELFTRCARSIRPDFELTDANARQVAEICLRLDGLPLAIELAAARARVLSPRAILERLQRGFDLLKDGPQDESPRHRTLRAAIAWSHDLLDERARRLFRRLAVFAGSWTLESAEAVCTDAELPDTEILSLLEALSGQSLVVAERRGEEVRYRLLETVRAFALEQTRRADEEELLRERHRDWYVRLTRRLGRAAPSTEQATWLAEVEADLGNFRLALRWCLEREEASAGLRLVNAIWMYWAVRGALREWRAWLTDLLAQPSAAQAGGERAQALDWLSYLALAQGDLPTSEAFASDGLALGRALGDQLAQVLALRRLGAVVQARGEFGSAAALYGESLRLARDMGDRAAIYLSLVCLADAARAAGNLDEAERRYRDSLEEMERAGDRWHTAHALLGLGQVARARGEAAAAARLYGEALALLRELDDRRLLAACLEALAELAGLSGDAERGAWLLGAAEALHEATGTTRSASPFVAPDRERAIGLVSGLLPQAALQEAWSAGRAAPLAWVLERALREAAPGPEPAAALGEQPPTDPLTSRELEIAVLVAGGRTNRQIAEVLVIAKPTVDRHIANILNKLGFSSRAQVAAWVAERATGRDGGAGTERGSRLRGTYTPV